MIITHRGNNETPKHTHRTNEKKKKTNQERIGKEEKAKTNKILKKERKKEADTKRQEKTATDNDIQLLIIPYCKEKQSKTIIERGNID